jgi:hypothetical protein
VTRRWAVHSIGERREARGGRREARGERREARGERREARGERVAVGVRVTRRWALHSIGERREARGGRREAGGGRREGRRWSSRDAQVGFAFHRREARGERREARGGRREARGGRREARGERREARGERREARGERREAGGGRREGRRWSSRDAQGGFALASRGLMVFEEIIRSSPRRRALPCIAEGSAPQLARYSGLNAQPSSAPRREGERIRFICSIFIIVGCGHRY